MANRFSTWMKKRVLRKDQNLVSLESPYAAMQRLLTGEAVDAIVDAGASNGHISQRLLSLFPRAQAYAFEPNERYREELQRLAQADRRVHPVFAALSDHAGVEKLYTTRSAGNTSLLAPDERLAQISPEGHEVERVVEVPVTTLDAWATAEGVDRVDVMKFDIQGGELLALRGGEGLLTETLAVYAEIWLNPAYQQGALFGDVDAWLRRFDFVLYDLYKPKYGPGGLLMWANVLWVKSRLTAL